MAAARPRAPRRRPLRAVLGGLAALALGVGVASCAGGDGSSSATDAAARSSAGAAVSAGADCLAPQVLDALGFAGGGASSTAHPDVPDAGPVPDGFSAVSAVLCSTGETLTDAAGRWAAVTATRLEGDVRPLLTALTASSTVPAAGATPTPCAADAERADLWLVDALGAAVRVALPSGGCGPLPVSVTEGLEVLDPVDVEHYPVELVGPRATGSPTGS